jgi:hypothetical protein
MLVGRRASFRPIHSTRSQPGIRAASRAQTTAARRIQLIGKHADASNLEDRIARKGSAMMEFLFQVTLLASIRVKAETQAEAEVKLRSALEASEANLEMLCDTPIFVPVAIEGEFDLIEAMENAGEE